MDQGFEQLKHYIGLVQPLSEKDWLGFAAIWEPYQAKRKEMLTVRGQTERYLYFVLEGAQRVFYLDAEGREATLVFTYAPSFGGVLDAMLQQEPSSYYYETLTTSRFLRCPFSALLELQKSHPAIQEFVLKSLTRAFAGLLTRMAQLQCFSAQEKFQALFQRSPQLLNQVPHKYLANYLGIDASNFSKFLNNQHI
ncbi:Crp/Fnr family transcriptional regulator [Pedobacter sp. GR22-6]|uniref:Crp/Fnr family transcriptional regulator n=1 Tax=Pedobacter sp. GR22-6 TaxID=3127957 RepID=UPI00307F970C